MSDNQPGINDVSSSYGAPMGRWESTKDVIPQDHTVRVFVVPINKGGYDRGGAYWGIGQRLYCATDQDGYRRFVRATNRFEAIKELNIPSAWLQVCSRPTRELDKFTLAYCVAMLWSSNDESSPEGGVPMDSKYGIIDIHPETMATIIADCQNFQDMYASDFNGNFEQAGHDYWLTRNRHGTGFWDRSDDVYDKEARERLTAAAKANGERYPYVYRRKIWI